MDMKILFLVFLLGANFHVISQSSEDSLLVSKQDSISKLWIERMEEYYIQQFEIDFSLNTNFEDSILVRDKWSLAEIFSLYCDPAPEIGQKALYKFIDYQAHQGCKIKIFEYGHGKLPTVENYKQMEEYLNVVLVPSHHTMGCIRNACANELMNDMNDYYDSAYPVFKKNFEFFENPLDLIGEWIVFANDTLCLHTYGSLVFGADTDSISYSVKDNVITFQTPNSETVLGSTKGLKIEYIDAKRYERNSTEYLKKRNYFNFAAFYDPYPKVVNSDNKIIVLKIIR